LQITNRNTAARGINLRRSFHNHIPFSVCPNTQLSRHQPHAITKPKNLAPQGAQFNNRPNPKGRPMLDLARLRADTPACRDVIHFNNAGAALMPDAVYNAQADHLALERRVGGYEAARLAAPQLAAFYTEFAALLNCDPTEIAYAENATRAWDMAFYALPLAPGDRILTHASEYVSNYLAFLHQAKRRGLHIDVVPSDATGQIDVAALDAMVTPAHKLIAITHVPSQSGLVNPAAAVGQIARKHGLTYLLDACQSVGQVALDVQAIGCHILSGTGRKFLRGPRGTGFLYISNSIVDSLDPPFIDLTAAHWSDDQTYTLAPGALRFENWESNVAGRIGLTAAVTYARGIGIDAIQNRTATLAQTLREALTLVPGVTVRDQGQQKCGIVTFTKDGIAPETIYTTLREAMINVSVTPLTYARLDLGPRGLTGVVRASVHYYNDEGEVDRFIGALGRIG
jgi:cysteine desulfurase / selenocysteine lyase